jgi:hypothetical protein
MRFPHDDDRQQLATSCRRGRAASHALQGGRENGRRLTLGFRRYVQRVLSADQPTPGGDIDALLGLAEDIMDLHRTPVVDAVLGRIYADSARRLATVVRSTGRGAVAHPALLARAIVVARSVQRAAAGRMADAVDQRALAVAA